MASLFDWVCLVDLFSLTDTRVCQKDEKCDIKNLRWVCKNPSAHLFSWKKIMKPYLNPALFLFLVMQLFICPNINIAWTQLVIRENSELINQLRKVLRAKPWYQFYIQTQEQRYRLILERWTDKEIYTQIQEIQHPSKEKKTWMLITFPNKQEKLELIVQKLTEIWISHIYLRASERSVVKSLNENKKHRLQKIIQEATEQSWNWNVPILKILQHPQELFDERSFVIFDLESSQKTFPSQDSDIPLLWVVGPEWGLTSKDYDQFPKRNQIFSLWKSVLRMETAAIVWAWKIKNR